MRLLYCAMEKDRYDAEREERIVRMGKVTVRQSGCGAGFAAALLSTWVDRCQRVCRSRVRHGQWKIVIKRDESGEKRRKSRERGTLGGRRATDLRIGR